MSAIGEHWRGGTASLRFLLGAPATFRRVSVGARHGADARAPIYDHFSRFLDDCGFGVTVEGDPPAPGRGCVVCHNETSFADVAAYFVAVWPHVDRLTGADLYGYIPFVTGACGKLDIEMVARGNRLSTDRLVERMVAAARNGDRVGWGGEGRLSGQDGLGRYKIGASLIAIRAGVPVVPVVIHGGHHRMPLGTVRARRGGIRIRFCPPVPTEGRNESDARDFADALQALAGRHYAEMSEGRIGSGSAPSVPSTGS